jgi:hypothetical protein
MRGRVRFPPDYETILISRERLDCETNPIRAGRGGVGSSPLQLSASIRAVS